jgi:hypothetical protein
MMQVHIAHEFAVRDYDTGKRLSADDLHGEGERLMDALLDLEEVNADVTDVATATDADRGVVTAEMVVSAAEMTDAVAKFQVVARTAIQAIGGATPGWERTDSGANYEPTALQLEYV